MSKPVGHSQAEAKKKIDNSFQKQLHPQFYLRGNETEPCTQKEHSVMVAANTGTDDRGRSAVTSVSEM